jgi:hypothetical protein
MLVLWLKTTGRNTKEVAQNPVTGEGLSTPPYLRLHMTIAAAGLEYCCADDSSSDCRPNMEQMDEMEHPRDGQ